MVIVIHRDILRLAEPEDCRAFKVVVEAGTETQVMQALAQVGRMADRDTAWIRTDAVRSMADGRVDADWENEFAAMLAYAATKGWLDDDGTEIQAHIEWTT
ncbi:MAG TPA: hypothetical protein VI916_05005 [Acidimicrobiia bacterium]|nr:hypothetical protein [Acidimicrobiia bacterium]